MLRLKDVSWTAPGGAGILKNVTLDIQPGLTVVTGPNGGGKTTLAKVIAGIVKPDTGRIYLDDDDITDLDVTARARRGIGYAFQQPVRFKGLTVRDLLELAAGRDLKQGEMCDLLSSVGLCCSDYCDRSVDASLSGGEHKRIEIASVLARHTQFTVFDEPEAGIDLWSFQGLVHVFRKLREDRNQSMLVISHQERLLAAADQIIVLANGSVREAGKREDILPNLPSDEKVSCPRWSVELDKEENAQ